jgi:hypothetical protein
VPLVRPEELRKRLAVTNGGAAELLPGGEPSPAKSRHGEELTGTGDVVRYGCARTRSEGWSGGASSTVSHCAGVKAYHGVPMRAASAGGRNGARGAV